MEAALERKRHNILEADTVIKENSVKRKRNNNATYVCVHQHQVRGDLEFTESRYGCDDVDELLTVPSRVQLGKL